jgi:hypothetical protein
MKTLSMRKRGCALRLSLGYGMCTARFTPFGEDQRSSGSLPSLKPGEILGSVALAECFTGCWGDVFGGVWLGFPCADGPSSCVGTFLVLEPAVFVEPTLLAIIVSPGPRRPETYHSFAGFAAWPKFLRSNDGRRAKDDARCS